MDKKNLEAYAKNLRVKTFDTIHKTGSGHFGGSLSIIELLTYIYNEEIDLNKNNVNGIKRDIFVLSKGHAVPPVYEILKEKNILDKECKLRELGSPMQGHPDKNKCPGIDASTGSLGQGLSIAVGIAYGQYLKGNKYKTIALVGDGEMQEGICYEALSFATTHNLSNLVVIIDCNKLQLMGEVKNISVLNYCEVLKSMGASVYEINGHDFDDIDKAFKNLDNNKLNIIIANTVKGKGVSFMENNYKWHGTPTNEEQYEKGMSELKGVL